jgi:hypothetical protein
VTRASRKAIQNSGRCLISKVPQGHLCHHVAVWPSISHLTQFYSKELTNIILYPQLILHNFLGWSQPYPAPWSWPIAYSPLPGISNPTFPWNSSSSSILNWSLSFLLFFHAKHLLQGVRKASRITTFRMHHIKSVQSSMTPLFYRRKGQPLSHLRPSPLLWVGWWWLLEVLNIRLALLL